ncbi:HU family DNA-binding protein [Candidatus Berkiella aquae]|uniref:Viral histone-like protein n=1 Tax=Candidatus Berkiella aquae TaxID=295108 RepID=A0A0Q9YLY3_9GAMM|nr:HU family DNA-binding protein [Candidatus Berkiella aquae]MCS5710564.1 HU family DNA-binding protein [Candidatus Berkiella aquae]
MAGRKKASPKAKATAAKPVAAKKARATAKATPARAAATASFSSKAIAQKQSKSQIYTEIAEMVNVSKNDVKNVISAIRNIVERHVKPKGSGEVVIPDLGIKVRRISKKATKARMGRNPFTGEEIQIPAKPARKSVKVSALKTLKALIEE